MSISQQIRIEIIRRARDKRLRTAKFTKQEPCEWRPWQVLHPKSGLPFSDAGAWNFIADLLEDGHEAATIILDKPPGMEGYEIVADGFRGCPKIYIKVTLPTNTVHGRSFHNSEH